MQARQVTRYICEYCGKKRLVRWAMERHEKHCTMNPQRVCRMCAKIKADAAPLAELIAILPNPTDYTTEDESGITVSGTFGTAVDGAMPKLREAAGGCPMCMLAAIRQSGINKYAWIRFDFQAELQSIWNEFNAEAEARYMGY